MKRERSEHATRRSIGPLAAEVADQRMSLLRAFIATAHQPRSLIPDSRSRRSKQ